MQMKQKISISAVSIKVLYPGIAPFLCCTEVTVQIKPLKFGIVLLCACVCGGRAGNSVCRQTFIDTTTHVE